MEEDMVTKLILSAVFLILLFETLSVLTRGIKRELDKNMELGSTVNKFKIAGISALIVVGFYIELFLVWYIWLTDIQLHPYLKITTAFLAVFYLLGVVGLSFSMKKAPEFGGLASRMTTRLSP